jgi:hypothetical protein
MPSMDYRPQVSHMRVLKSTFIYIHIYMYIYTHISSYLCKHAYFFRTKLVLLSNRLIIDNGYKMLYMYIYIYTYIHMYIYISVCLYKCAYRTFRNILATTSSSTMAVRCEFLKRCPFLEPLTNKQIT